MINGGKCPKCDKVVSAVRIENVDVREGFQSKWHGVSYCCTNCSAVLSVGIDPIAIKTDIVNELKKHRS